MKVLGDRLKALRQEKNLTQDELAKALQLTKQNISNYENDARSPDFETLTRIANFFNVSTDYMLGRIGQKRLENVDIGTRTGLLEKSIEKLGKLFLEDTESFEYTEYMNALIQHDLFHHLIESIYLYATRNFKIKDNALQSLFSEFSKSEKDELILNEMSVMLKDGIESFAMKTVIGILEDIVKDFHAQNYPTGDEQNAIYPPPQ